MAPARPQADLEEVAARLVWWQEPARILARPERLLAQAMVYGTADDLEVVRRFFSDEALRGVLRNPPPGVFDPRSWAYWHLMLDMGPAPELPRRAVVRQSSVD